MKSLILCSLLILAIGCNSTKAKKDASIDSMLTDGSYKITTIVDTDVSAENLTLLVSENGQKIAGHAGCNSYFGSVNPAGSDVLFTDMGTTKMYCDAKMATEKSFLSEMNRVVSISIKENKMNMTNADGEIIITASKE